MKKTYLWGLSLLAIITAVSCDDETGSMGLGMMPPSDLMKAESEVYEVTTRSVLTGPVYAKTTIGYVGRFSDPDFGYYETNFLAQLNCVSKLTFPEAYDEAKQYKEKDVVMAGDTTHLAELYLYYGKYFGDPNNACRMNLFELNKKLDKNYHTDINPEEYFDRKDLLGSKAYSAYDPSVSDSIRSIIGYSDYIRFQLPKEVGERILRLNREHPEYFADSESFIEHVFPGIYVENDYGDGTILYVDQINLNVVYNTYTIDSLGSPVKDEEGKPVMGKHKKTFSSTKEIIQANRLENSEKLKEKAGETDWTYLKTPAGIFTEVTLPIRSIADNLKNDTINAVKIVFDGYHHETGGKFGMSPPSTIMMVRGKEADDFFSTNRLYDGKTSFATVYSTTGKTANQYVFGNISQLIAICIAEKEAAEKEAGSAWNEEQWIEENKWDKVILIPVEIETITSGSTSRIVGVRHDLKPGYVKLKGGEKDKLDMKVYYIRFTK